MDRRLDIEEFVQEKLLKGKKPSRIFLWILKKVLCVDFLNELIDNTSGNGADFCEQVLQYLNIKIEVQGLENIPKDGTLYTFASNHPLGAIDGMALCHLIGHRFGSVEMMVNDFLMLIKPLTSICVPVNKIGSQARALSELVNKSFSSDNQILIFPAGLCSRMIDGKVQDIAWSKTFIRKSLDTQRAIVPVHFIGENSRCFYNIARLSKKLGLKFNIAMLFLFKEVKKSRGKGYKIVFGEPLKPDFFDSSKTAIQWADWTRTKIYTL